MKKSDIVCQQPIPSGRRGCPEPAIAHPLRRRFRRSVEFGHVYDTSDNLTVHGMHNCLKTAMCSELREQDRGPNCTSQRVQKVPPNCERRLKQKRQFMNFFSREISVRCITSARCTTDDSRQEDIFFLLLPTETGRHSIVVIHVMRDVCDVTRPQIHYLAEARSVRVYFEVSAPRFGGVTVVTNLSTKDLLRRHGHVTESKKVNLLVDAPQRLSRDTGY
jgi:hypothetical protein